MQTITQQTYWNEISELAADIEQEAKEYGQDVYDLLHETIDGHQWIIYYGYNLDVLRFTDNEDYMIDNLGSESAAESLKEGLNQLHCHLAFWAMFADVSEQLN